MKKLLITLLFSTMAASAQTDRNVMFIFGVDANNLIQGSEPTQNKSALDLTGGVALKTGNGGLQAGINYQHFPKIGYYDLEFEVGYILQAGERWLITPQMSSKLIMRGGDMVEKELNGQEFIGQKVSLNVKFEVFPSVYFGLDGGLTFRGDKFALNNDKAIGKALVFDGTVEVTYKFDFN